MRILWRLVGLPTIAEKDASIVSIQDGDIKGNAPRR